MTSLERFVAPAQSIDYALHGEIDLSNADRIRLAARRAAGSGFSTLVLDLTDVTFMDCTGVNALLDAATSLQHAGGTLVLRAVPPQVQRLLAVTGATDALVIGDAGTV